MNISYNWLAQYVDLHCGLDELCRKMTMAGIEVEAIEKTGVIPDGVIVAEILERKPHPNAEKLSVCQVFDGTATLQIVCGAPNCDAGKKVPLATIGTTFVSDEGDFTIKKAKLRGVESNGMMCSAAELGIGNDHDGLLELDPALKCGTPVTTLFKCDAKIEVEVTPNRPDWLSHWGIARDVACLLNVPAKLPAIAAPPAGNEKFDRLVTVEAPELCSRYIGRVIRNVRIAESPDWLKERLLSVGLRPINNVVDVTNFVMLELGQPLHAFDLARLEGNRVVVRRARPGEQIRTLDGKEFKLAERHLVIADAAKPMALAGVMGGEFSGVSDATTDILLESAIFQTSNIRSTSRELGLSTDASHRYERGVDWMGAELAADRATQLICELTGGTPAGEAVDVNTGVPQRKAIFCRFDRIRSLIGIDLDNAGMLDIFHKLHLEVRDFSATSCSVVAPLFRPDLEREADLAEEVARVHGLDAVPVRPVTGKMVGSIDDDAYMKIQSWRDAVVELGFYECMHYSLVKESSARRDSRFQLEDAVRLKNPLSLDLAWLRPSLWGEMLETVERNIARRNLDLRLFELSRAFCANPALFPEERMACILAMTGRRHPELYGAAGAEAYDFYDLKGAVESLLKQRGIRNWSIEAADDARFAAGVCACIKVDGQIIGHLGEIAAGQKEGMRTTYPVFAAELEMLPLWNAEKVSSLYVPFSMFPAVSRDVAMLVDSGVTNGAVVDFIRDAKLPYLESVELFDLFEDEKTLGAGRRSLAYRLTFRHPERTLTDQEVNGAFERLRTKLVKGLGVELR